MSVTFWSFLSFIAVVTAQDQSKTVLDFQTLFTGHWDNKPQIEHGGQDHDFIEAWGIPVDIPALRPKPVMLIEEINNGVIRVLNLGVVSEGPEKNSIIMKLYNFTDITTVKPKMFDVQTLHTLTLEDLHSREDCFAEFDVVENSVLHGNFPLCSSTVNGRHPRFSLTFTCNSSVVSFPMGTSQKSPIGPYVFRYLGQRYPVINAPDDYVSPCQQ